MSAYILLFLSIFFSLEAYSHSGRLNSQGCHNGRKTSGYHCHRNLDPKESTSEVRGLRRNLQDLEDKLIGQKNFKRRDGVKVVERSTYSRESTLNKLLMSTKNMNARLVSIEKKLSSMNMELLNIKQNLSNTNNQK